MAYVGGKKKCADHIIELLNLPKFDNMDYLEPFVGYAHVLRRVKNKKSYTGNDVNALLITLLKNIQLGKHRPFPNITREQWLKYKNQPPNSVSINRAIAAFAYSFRGAEFKSYTHKSHGRNYPEERLKYYDELNSNENFNKTKLMNYDYRKLKPKGKLIYCDPPYVNTHGGYNSWAVFDTNEFWEFMRKWSKDNIVYISETTAPPDFKCVAKREKLNFMKPLKAGESRVSRVERLFTYAPNARAKSK